MAVSCVSVCLLIVGCSQFLGFADVELDILTDSSAARGILARQGVGKVRHLEVKTLWVQDLVKKKRLRVLPYQVRSTQLTRVPRPIQHPGWFS